VSPRDLPGAGWIDFCPTNSIIGNGNLIRVAVAWTHGHALSLWGTYDVDAIPVSAGGWWSLLSLRRPLGQRYRRQRRQNKKAPI
jgi:hypothetical protein